MNTNEMGVAKRVSATGAFSLGAGNNIGLVGVLVGASTAAPVLAIHHGATMVSGATMIAALTAPANAFTRIPAYLSGGATINVTGVEIPDLNIYWNPAG
jgi:hypothetical protein